MSRKLHNSQGARGVAIVGCGGIARIHAAAIEANPQLQLRGVVDSETTALARAEQELGVPGFAVIADLLLEIDADIACVSTPPATHRALVEELLRGGLDVLCEKPLAVCAADGRAMRELAARAGCRLAVSDKFRHVTDLLEAAERLEAGDIGSPLSFTVSFCAPVDVRGRWPSDPAMSGGGVIMDNAPHAFDVLSHVLESPIAELEGRLADPVLMPGVEDTATIHFRTEGGTIGVIELSWAYFTKDLDYLVVQATEGTMRVGWSGGQLRCHGEPEWTSFGSGYDKGDAFRRLWEAFATDRFAPARWPDPIDALELIESVYAGAARGWSPQG